MSSIEIALHQERAINPHSVHVLYQSVGWWPEHQEEEIAQVLNDDLAIGAWEDDRLIGFARVVSDHRFRAYIEDVIVHPDYQHKGIGSFMLTRLMGELHHIETITLFCQPELISFYERLGFHAFPGQRVMHQKGSQSHTT